MAEKIRRGQPAARKRLVDIVVGRGMSALSTAGMHAPVLRDMLAAPPTHPGNYVRMRWHYSWQTVDAVSWWATFEGESTAGRISRNYPLAAIISVDRDELNRLDNRYRRGREAVAFQLGTSVIMGGVSEQERHTLFTLSDNDERYLTAMRIGKGPLLASVGQWSNVAGFVGAQSVRAEERVPIPEMPPHIPLLG